MDKTQSIFSDGKDLMVKLLFETLERCRITPALNYVSTMMPIIKLVEDMHEISIASN
jgi:hypothetical protein